MQALCTLLLAAGKAKYFVGEDQGFSSWHRPPRPSATQDKPVTICLIWCFVVQGRQNGNLSRQPMDTDILKTFLEVNRTRHFGQAGNNLHLTQSAVSARIRLLEEQVGTPLFTRDRNNIQLTPAGQKLLRYAENIVTNWNRARQELVFSEEGTTPLAVGAMPSLWEIAVQGWIKHTFVQHPDIRLSVEMLAGERLVNAVQERSIDLAFVFDPPRSPDISTRQIGIISLVLVTRNSQDTLAQALRDNYIMVDWGTSFALSHAQEFPDTAPRMRAGQGRMALDLLLEYGGAAYIAEPMVRNYLANEQLHRVREAPEFERAAYAIYAADNPGKARILETLEHFHAPGT